MYFLDEDETRYVIRGLAPRMRGDGVAEELRGWRWNSAPLSPLYEAALSVEEIADTRCASGRDVYLRHVLGAQPSESYVSRVASALRDGMADGIVAAKRVIYEHGPLAAEVIRALPPPRRSLAGAESAADEGAAAANVLLWRFERRRIAARIEAALVRQPRIGADALAAAALPLTAGRRLDGRYLGLAAEIPFDAVGFPEPVVFALRLAAPEPWQRLAVAGQALLLEGLHETPVNLGAVVSVSIADGQLSLRRDLFAIDDELRQSFIDARDERARLVEEEIDPGFPAQCPDDCPLLATCHG